MPTRQAGTLGHVSTAVAFAGRSACLITLIGNVECLRRPEPQEMQDGLGAGGHVGGQDVVRVAVKVLAGSVVTHRGPWIGVAGSDLDVSQIDAGVEHGGDESMADWVCSREEPLNRAR